MPTVLLTRYADEPAFVLLSSLARSTTLAIFLFAVSFYNSPVARAQATGTSTQGSATQGSATQGSGSKTQKPSTQGSATQGSATQGSATQGSATQGSATQGSATQGSATQGSATQGLGSSSAGSATGGIGSGPNYAKMPVAIGGYCPVSILDNRKWVKGNPNISVLLDGKLYRFPSEQHRQTFLMNTTKYTPALGGDCIVCLVEGKKRVAGSVFHSAIHRGRLYLFPGKAEHAKFMANPTAYENADVALDGNCAVCRVEMQQQVPGTLQFGTVYGGMRYYFPDAMKRKAFLANPSRYAVKP